MNPVIDQFGTQRWLNEYGKLHRLDGPAVIGKDGYTAWYQNDKLHREDGPAIIRDDGTKKWYLYGYEYSELTYYKKLLTLTTDPSLVKSLKSKIIKMSLNET